MEMLLKCALVSKSDDQTGIDIEKSPLVSYFSCPGMLGVTN